MASARLSAFNTKRRPLALLALALFLTSGLWLPQGAVAQGSAPPPPAAAAPAPLQIPGVTSRQAPVADAPANPATAANTQGISAPSGYQLGGGDQIAVEVYGEEDLRSLVRLGADGAVSLPLLGSVRLSGLTLPQAAARLTELYGRDYLVNPRLNVSLVGFAKQRFTIMGQVNRPGSYELPEGAAGGIDLLEAVAMAGGYTRIAAPGKISVRRRDRVLRVNAKRMARQEGRGGFKVQAGDTITVGESIF